MHKCSNCGQNFEGNFCPNCGMKQEEEKQCPVCGTKTNASARFCNGCGYSFTNQKPAVQTQGYKSGLEKLYLILKYVPLAVFALFAALLFAFCAAPVAVMPEINFSYGTVYSKSKGILSDIPQLKGELIALLIFAVITFSLAAITFVTRFASPAKFKSIQVFGKKDVRVSELFDYIGFAAYFIIFLTGCIICGKIAALDEGAGIMSAGACPVLLIVFAIIFSVAGAGAKTVRFILKRNYPAFGENELTAELTAERLFNENRRAYFENILSSPPVEPIKVEKPEPPEGALKIARGKRTVEFFGLFFFISVGWSCWVMLVGDMMLEVSLPVLAFIVLMPMIIILSGYFSRLKHIDLDKFYVKRVLITALVVIFLLILIAIAEPTIVYCSQSGYWDEDAELKKLFAVASAYGATVAIYVITMFVFGLKVLKRLKAMRKADANYQAYVDYNENLIVFKKQRKIFDRHQKKYNKIKQRIEAR